MKVRMSMVHNNPGEPYFVTKFNDSKTVADYGFNGQVFRQINTIVPFDKLGLDIFPQNSEDRRWLTEFGKPLIDAIKKAKAEGLQTYHHIDLFVLPKKLVEIFKDEICDENGKISIEREKTLELHRIMFDELFEIVPELDGLIIRVGETYLHDTPYHIGNGAVEYGDIDTEKAQFTKLINFLREEICVKHNKKVFFRTWDCFIDRFHTNPEYYLEVTNAVEPHENLYLSIKYTALDFWRHVKWNECLANGKHQQIVEIQCQREYEGKGAYPTYVMNDVINGDAYLKNPMGLKKLSQDTRIKGVFVWPRGGGWNGPYSPDEFWSDLNTYVISHFAADTGKTEEEIFYDFVDERLHLSKEDALKFRKMCLYASEAILKARYITAYDETLNESDWPCKNWMRDDRLGGFYHLEPCFDVIFERGLMDEALVEKEQGYKYWEKIYELSREIDWSACDKGDFIKTSAEYGKKFFKVVLSGYKVMTYGYLTEKGIDKRLELKVAAEDYHNDLADYRTLANNENAATLYHMVYLWEQPGMDAAVERFEKLI